MRGASGFSVQWGMLCVLLGFAFVTFAILGFTHAYMLEGEAREEVAASCLPGQKAGCGAKPLTNPAAANLSASLTERYIASGMLVAGSILFCIGYYRSRKGSSYVYRPPRY